MAYRKIDEKEVRIKKCLCCGDVFTRNPKYSDKQWGDSRYCSRKCSRKSSEGSQEAWEKLIPEKGVVISEEHRKKMIKGIGRGKDNKLWKGGKTKNNGYIRHTSGERKYEHITVAEKKMGRKLEKGEVVHHIDGDRTNNFPSNLFVLLNAHHIKYHFNQKATYGNMGSN